MSSVKPQTVGKKTGRLNRGGRKKGCRQLASDAQVVSISALSRSYSPEAIETLVKIMRTHEKSAVAAARAAEAILDRGYGKPAQSVDLNVTGTLGLAERVQRAKARALAK